MFYFQVIIDPVKGQCLVATRKIKPLELIFSDLPAVCGPYAWPPHSQCLNCLKLTPPDKKCRKCNYPICSIECQKGDWHSIECKIFQKVGHKHNNQQDLSAYAPINTIRFLAIQGMNRYGCFCDKIERFLLSIYPFLCKIRHIFADNFNF